MIWRTLASASTFVVCVAVGSGCAASTHAGRLQSPGTSTLTATAPSINVPGPAASTTAPGGLVLPLASPQSFGPILGTPDPFDPCTIVAVVPNAELGFAFDSAQISADGARRLRQFAGRMVADPGTILSVDTDGYASIDGPGKAAYDMNLSGERAAAAADVIRGTPGIAGVDVTPHAFGEADPIAPNTTEAGRAQNRRVEIHVRFAGCNAGSVRPGASSNSSS